MFSVRLRSTLGGVVAVVGMSLAVGLTSLTPAAAATPSARAVDDSCPAGDIAEDGFVDVNATSAFEPFIDCLAHWGVSAGTSATRYSPTQVVTREQMATFISRLIIRSGGTLPASPPDRFSDDDSSRFELAINQLAEAGIVNGVSAGLYDPAGPVRRDQMAAFLVRASDYRAEQGGLTALPAGEDYFADDDGSSLEADINTAAAAGFAAGEADGTYRPSQPVLREQMAAFLTRVLDLQVENGLTTLPAASSPPASPQYRFGDGDWLVGRDISAGLYRVLDTDSCYWERASDASGEFEAIIANNFSDGPVVVQIPQTDVLFSSSGCGTWVPVDPDLSSPRTVFAGDGQYLVGLDIRPGTYRSEGIDSCYWERSSSALGDFESIIANDFGDGPATVTVEASDIVFTTSGCGTWRRLD